MSSATTGIGCPNCEETTVPVGRLARERDPDPEFRDADRLKGTSVDCRNCGDEFEVYFY